MAATGFTPISLYFSATAAALPSSGNLVAGELALNTNDGKLYFKNSSGTVTLLASSVLNNYTTTGTGTVLALATSPTLTTPTISGYTESVVAITLTSGGAVGTLVIAAGTVLTATLTAGVACTFAMPTSPTAGQSFILRLTQAATSMTTATFTGVKWPGGTAPTITATASAVDIISFVYIGTAWYGNAAQAFA
jgi:hypothetical protein